MFDPGVASFLIVVLVGVWALLIVKRNAEPYCDDCGTERFRVVEEDGTWKWWCVSCHGERYK